MFYKIECCSNYSIAHGFRCQAGAAELTLPRKAQTESLAELNAAPGGAAAVDRALSLLAAYREGDGSLSLAELAERTRLYKSTALRLIASLEHGALIQRTTDGRYSLGPEVARLNAIYTRAFSLDDIVLPVLRQLVSRTRESAAYHVRQGDQRLCLYRIDSPQPVRDHIRAGDLLPLNRGAGGRVISAFSGAKGKLYTRIRREHVVVMVGDRTPDLAGISAPVFGPGHTLAGALTLTMPSIRLKREQAAWVLEGAQTITSRLGGQFPPKT
jgi:DNA-binding IclR family transcriptional regulator